MVTSGYRPGDPGYHGLNRARDFSNGFSPTSEMMAFARYMIGNFGSHLAELIYSPLGFSIKNGAQVPPYAVADHFDHVHVAMEKGGHVRRSGWAVVGERGPELAHLPGGTNVYSNADSQRMGSGGDSMDRLATAIEGLNATGTAGVIRALAEQTNGHLGARVGLALHGIRSSAGNVAGIA